MKTWLKVFLTIVGLILIVIPEPATTATGLALVVYVWGLNS